MDIDELEANYQAQKQAGAFDKPTAPKKSNWLLNLLPTAGGTIGGVAGSFIAPGAGTVAGGAGGSALGELLRQKLSGEKGIGYKKLATEAAFGAIPLGAGKGVGIAAKGASGVAKGAAKTAGEQAVMKGVQELISGTRRIPVKFVEDAAMSAAKRPYTARSLMINPTIGDIIEKTGKTATTGRVGNYMSAATSGNKLVPFVETARTRIPVRIGTATKTSIQNIPETIAPKTVAEVFEEPAKEATKTGIKGAIENGTKTLTTVGREGILQKIGKNLRAASRGITPTSKQGAGTFSANRADEVNKYVSEVILPKAGKTKGLTPNSAKRLAEEHKQNLYKAYDASDEAKALLPKSIAQETANNATRNVMSDSALKNMTTKNRAIFDDYINKISNAKTNKEFTNIITDINSKVKPGTVAPTGAVVEQQALYDKLRKTLVKARNENLPVASKLAKEASLTEDYIQSAINQGGRLAGGNGGWSANLLAAAKQSGEMLGRPIEALGKVTAAPISRIIARETIPRTMFGSGLGVDTTAEPAQQPQEQSQGLQDIYGGTGADMGTTGVQQGMPTESQYPQQNFVQDVIKDMQVTGGKNVANLKMIYELMNPEPTKESIKSQDAQFAGSQSLSILDSLERQYEKSGGARGRIPGLIATGAGKVGAENQVNVYNDARTGFLSNIARSLGEKGVLTDQDIIRIANIIPKVTDNQEEAAARWEQVREIISSGMERAQNSYAQPATQQYDLTSLMQQ